VRLCHDRDVRNPLAVLLWMWLAVSLSVYGYRLWRRVKRGAKPAAGPLLPPVADAPLRSSVTDQPRQSPGTSTDPSTHPPLVTSPGSAPIPGRAGLFAERAEPAADRPSRVPIAEALAGIEMPCGLAPLMGDPEGLSPFRASFVTSGVPAHVVGAGLADQLEALGYTLNTMAENQAVAVRDGSEVTVTVHTDVGRFPTAAPGSVVAVLAT
jgi:hypothetical protein